jgi:hypothetical protein
LADLTPHNLLDHIVAVCAQSSIVAAYTIRILDLDILSLRVYLVDDSFIEVFYNVVTGKIAFALILEERRIYGKDNAKMGWHVHPPDNPKAHLSCEPVSFETFLAEAEALRFSSTSETFSPRLP